MSQITINRELCAIGLRVTRGPGWEWDNQDGGKGSVGTIVDEPYQDGWVSVSWDNGEMYTYRVGAEGRYDLALYSPFIKTGIDLTNKPQTQRLQEMRQGLSQSIKKAESLIEKSNTKHGNSNTSSSSTGAIKVRRPIIKIQGTKG